MKKVYEILGHDKPKAGDVGIEIEIEGKDMKEVQTHLWHTEDDGSLRGRYPEGRAEFVLNEPIALKDVRKALEELREKQEGAQFDFSFRTSCHVHLNVQDLTYDQLLNVVYTYLLLEEPLTTYCGKERKGNRFCLRLQDAEGALHHLEGLFKDPERQIPRLHGDAIRYAAINLAALPKYGSVEFRAMRGNMDVDVITTWCEALCAIRAYALTKGNPTDIYEEFRHSPPTAFLKTVLGDLAKHFLYPRMIKDIQRSFSLSLDLPFAYRAAKIEAAKAVERAKEPVKPKKLPVPPAMFMAPGWDVAGAGVDMGAAQAAALRKFHNAFQLLQEREAHEDNF